MSKNILVLSHPTELLSNATASTPDDPALLTLAHNVCIVMSSFLPGRNS
jgi:hypothetical protein